MKKHVIKWVLLGLVVLVSQCSKDLTPNFIIIFCDDMGYGDLACFGSEKHRTPNLDQMAAEGIRLTDFYVTSGVCTPSRSSLMTGCYPQRVNMHVNARPFGVTGRQVLFGKANKGLNPEEITLAEILRSKGYKTACIGKWHLGDQAPFLPTKQGFDYYYGIPYSNDMTYSWCPTPLMRNEEVIEQPVDQNTLTKRYTEETIKFINENSDVPFFVYLPHSMVHNPLHASDAFRGTSKNGIYGDATEEIDWSVGEIIACLKNLGLDETTFMLFTSDNGAASPFGGSNLPLSGWKGSTNEGGMRVPCIIRWPEQITGGLTTSEMATTMDLVPTVSKLVGYEFPDDRIIDGKDIFNLITKKDVESPYDVFYFYRLENLEAVRSGQWKLLLPLDSMYNSIHRGTFKEGRELQLIDLSTDIAEKTNLAEKHPDIVKQLLKYADDARFDLGDLGQEGKNTRAAGYVEVTVPQILK